MQFPSNNLIFNIIELAMGWDCRVKLKELPRPYIKFINKKLNTYTYSKRLICNSIKRQLNENVHYLNVFVLLHLHCCVLLFPIIRTIVWMMAFLILYLIIFVMCYCLVLVVVVFPKVVNWVMVGCLVGGSIME